MSGSDDEEICVVASFPSAEQAELVRSRLPAAWNAEVDGADVLVVADDEAHAEEIENALNAPDAEPAPAGGDAGTEIAGGVIQAAVNLLDYL